MSGSGGTSVWAGSSQARAAHVCFCHPSDSTPLQGNCSAAVANIAASLCANATEMAADPLQLELWCALDGRSTAPAVGPPPKSCCLQCEGLCAGLRARLPQLAANPSCPPPVHPLPYPAQAAVSTSGRSAGAFVHAPCLPARLFTLLATLLAPSLRAAAAPCRRSTQWAARHN